MRTLFQNLFKIFFGILERLFPEKAARWAVKLFFTPIRHHRPEREQFFMKQAISHKVVFQPDIDKIYNPDTAKDLISEENFNSNHEKKFYMLYELGEGLPVLLVHGWSGRGSQMAFIARTLVENGFKIVTFDAFAHGESPGKQTTMLEFAEIIKDISKSYPEFEAIVGHSIGAVSAAKAIKQGVKSKKLVTIGAPANAHYIVEAFSSMINGSGKVKNYLKTFLEKYTNRNLSDFSLAKISSDLTIPGLIIHDEKDRDVLFSQALDVEESWSRARLLTTKGLGHTRILRDEKVIEHILKFIKNDTYSEKPVAV